MPLIFKYFNTQRNINSVFAYVWQSLCIEIKDNVVTVA